MVPVIPGSFLDDEVPPEAGHADEGDHVDGVEGGDEGEDDEPEPERDVDLLVDDVQSEDTQSVQLLDGSRGSVLVESALGHPGENLHHGVGPVLVLHAHEVDHICPVGHEDSSQEKVDEIHLTDDIDEVEKVAEDVSEGKEMI